jgi:hypothetical protein
MPLPDGFDATARRHCVELAAGRSRRSFLGQVGAVVVGLLAGPVAAARAGRSRRVPGSEPIPGGWYGFCGHYFTTGSCPGPYRLPRVDAKGFPLRPADGRPIDNLGRLVDRQGQPVDDNGRRLTGPDGLPLAAAPRTRLCEDWVPEQHGIEAVRQGVWYRCCDGQLRRLVDCCSTSRRRVNGDASLRGYCYGERRVYCVLYYDTGVSC